MEANQWQGEMGRRAFLRRAGLAGGALLAGGQLLPAAGPELITRSKDPLNLESPFAALNSFLTPSELFYVRNHYPQPKIDRMKYRQEPQTSVPRPALGRSFQLVAVRRPLVE